MASKRRLRRKSCEGKQRYPDIPAAMAGIRHVQRTYGYSGPMDAYHCKLCGKIHIGHKKGIGSHRPMGRK